MKDFYTVGGIRKIDISYIDYGKSLLGKKILITGGGSGIGYAIAKKSLQCGAEVIITGRNIEKLERACSSLGSEHIAYIKWDLSDFKILNDKLHECFDRLDGHIDILVNNAGVAPSKFWGSVDELEWDRIYSTNVKGLYFLSQSITQIWNKQSDQNIKKILNISSQGAFVGATYPYRMSKWDIRGLTEGLGKLLIKNNIIVNAIAPGIVKTDMQPTPMGQSKDNIYISQNPAGRYCLPEEIAELAIFLMNDSSNFIIGQTIVCDGGFILN